MLRLKQLELESKLQAEATRLERVETRLRRLENEGNPPTFEIAIKEISAFDLLSARAVAANEKAIEPARNSLLKLIGNHLKRARLKPTTPWISIVDNLPYDENRLEVELGIGVSSESHNRIGDWGSGKIQLKHLDPVDNIACTIHEGSYHSIQQAYTALYAWTQSNAYKITGPCREIYLPDTGVSLSSPMLDTNFVEVQCPVKRVCIPISIQSYEDRKVNIMEPKIVSKPAFKTVGLSYVGKNEHGEIPKMWGLFNQRYPEIEAIDPSCCYGLCFSTPVETETSENIGPGVFEYVAAAEVTDDEAIPKNMVYREVPDHKYLVFPHHGRLDFLHETYKYIYETWLPQSEYKLHPSKFDMEVYTDEFIMDSEESKFYIYVAVQ